MSQDIKTDSITINDQVNDEVILEPEIEIRKSTADIAERVLFNGPK